MSKLSELLKLQVSTAKPANRANASDPPVEVSNFSNIRSADSEALNLWAASQVSLSVAQEAARANVLSQLACDLAIRRAFVNRFEGDGTMIVTVGIRGVGTGEIHISAARFNQASLDDFSLLLGCIRGTA